MQFGDYLRVISRQWPVILLCTLLGIGAGFGVAAALGTTYRAQSQVMIAVTGAANPEESSAASTYLAAAIDTYATAAGSQAVLGPVAQKMAQPTTSQQLARRVNVEREPRTFILNVTATGDTGADAAQLADAVAQQTSDTLPALAILPRAGQQKVKVTPLAPAEIPEKPSGPTGRLTVGGGALLGLITGLSLAVMRDGRRRPPER